MAGIWKTRKLETGPCKGATEFSFPAGKSGPLPQYGSFISRIFPYHGKHFHAMEWDKTMKIGFSNLFLQYRFLKCDVIVLQTFPFEPLNLIMRYAQLL